MKTLIFFSLVLSASLSFAVTNTRTASTSNSVNTGTPGSTIAVSNPNMDSNRIPSASPDGSLPPSSLSSRATFPESGIAGQSNPPTQQAIERQRNEMNRQRQQIRNRADCSSIVDVDARANCESHHNM